MKQGSEDFGYAHGADDVGVEAGVHAFAAAFARVSYGCVVDDDVDVAVRCFGVFACANDGAVFGDVDLDYFDGAWQVEGLESFDSGLAFLDRTRAEENMPRGCSLGEQLAGELETDAAVGCGRVSVICRGILLRSNEMCSPPVIRATSFLSVMM